MLSIWCSFETDTTPMTSMADSKAPNPSINLAPILSLM